MGIVAGKQTEETYRENMLDSSSSLKEFSLDRKKYHRKYILNEDVREKENTAIIIGKVVETLLLEPELFDSKFYMSSCVSEPTGLMLAFVEALYTSVRESMNDEGIIQQDFEDALDIAYEASGFKIKKEAVIAKFTGSDAEIYFQEILKVRVNNLTVVGTRDIENANRIVDNLRTNFVTKDIVSLVSSDRYTILDQYQIQGYFIDDMELKSMLDRIIIDHKEKTITPYDLKCTWTVENFYTEYYLYRRAYIQGFLYYHACLFLKNNNPDYADYKVNFIKFIVCDSTNYFNPLVYSLSESDMEDAYNGFILSNGREYPGVKEIIKDLKWAMEEDIWNISRKNYERNGILNIKE